MVTRNIGMTYSGIGPDFRVLLRQARKLAQTYYLQYQSPIPTSQLVQRIASVMQEYTQSGLVPIMCHYNVYYVFSRYSIVGEFCLICAQICKLYLYTVSLDTIIKHPTLPISGVRPFGVSLLIIGYDKDDEERPYLYQCDPSVSLS